MKKLFRNENHKNGHSYDCLVAEIGTNNKKVKMTYEARNALERCTVEFFDGDKWNVIFGMYDMGVEPESSAYNIWSPERRKKRADELFKIAEKMCNSIL